MTNAVASVRWRFAYFFFWRGCLQYLINVFLIAEQMLSCCRYLCKYTLGFLPSYVTINFFYSPYGSYIFFTCVHRIISVSHLCIIAFHLIAITMSLIVQSNYWSCFFFTCVHRVISVSHLRINAFHLIAITMSLIVQSNNLSGSWLFVSSPWGEILKTRNHVPIVLEKGEEKKSAFFGGKNKLRI